MNIVCAIYARVSDESQLKGESILHQISYCKEIARRRGAELMQSWTTPEELLYVDQAITGTSLIKRAAVQQLVKDAKSGRFDVVLFKGISRFARDTVDALIMLRTLLACGIRVLSLEENFDSQRDNAEFVFTIHSALAQAESEKIAIRVRMGALQKAKQGKWNGPPPDGYVLNSDTQKLEIDETYAPIIRTIFQLYTELGYGTRKIAERLNQQRIATKRGCSFSQRSIARILANPAYAGDVAYGQREQRYAAPENEEWLTRRKKTVRIAQPMTSVCCPDAHPAIISREVFELASERLDERHTVPGRSGQIHLLSRGILMCRCMASMTVKYNTQGVRYYRCVNQVNRGQSACSQPYLRADDVEHAVFTRLTSDVIDRIAPTDWPTATTETTVRRLLRVNPPDVYACRQLIQKWIQRIDVNHFNLSIVYRITEHP